MIIILAVHKTKSLAAIKFKVLLIIHRMFGMRRKGQRVRYQYAPAITYYIYTADKYAKDKYGIALRRNAFLPEIQDLVIFAIDVHGGFSESALNLLSRIAHKSASIHEHYATRIFGSVKAYTSFLVHRWRAHLTAVSMAYTSKFILKNVDLIQMGGKSGRLLLERIDNEPFAPSSASQTFNG